MIKVRNFLHIFAFLFAIGFTSNAFAAGYSCPTYLKYTSCASGYYMTANSTSTACTASTPAAGNACRPCSAYSVGYTCSGGTACPVATTYTVTLDRVGGTGGDTSLMLSYNDQMPQISLPTRAGYVFDGYMDENDRWIYDSDGNPVISYWDIPYNTTLYAQWSLPQIVCSAGQYLPANATSCSTCTAGSYCPGGTFYQNTSVQGLTACPTNYTNGGTGLSTQNQCKFQTTAGNYIATANATTATTCEAGYACPSTLISYGSTGSRTQCTNATYSAAGAGSCSSCPTNYTANMTAGKTAASQCQIQTSNGYYIATANDTSQTICTAGYYCSGLILIAYGSTGGRTSCPTNYDDGGVGLLAQSSCTFLTTAGTYVATANATSAATCTAGNYCPSAYVTYGNTNSPTACPTNYDDGGTGLSAAGSCKWQTTAGTYVATANATTATTCTVGNYCPSTLISYGDTGGDIACTTLGSNYTMSTSGSSANTACYIPSTTLTADKYIGTMNSNTISSCSSGSYKAAHNYYYGSAAETCSNCSNKPSSAAYTSTGGGVNSCPWSLTCSSANYFLYNATETSRACAPCTAGNYCPGAIATQATAANAGITACPTNYVNGGTGLYFAAQCQIQTTAGQWIATANASTQTTCTAGYYCPGGLVYYGDMGIRNACPTNYDDGGTGLSAQADCKWQTTAGQYIVTANATTATTCTAGYACPSALISYGSTGTQTQCTGATFAAAGAGTCSTCPTNYTANTTAGKTANTQCQFQTTAGNYIATANATTQTTCPVNNSCPATLISYGSTGVANPCAVCAAVNASCSLSVVSNVCTYTTSCNTGYENIVNNGSYNATCSASTYTVTFDKQSGTGGSTSVTATYDAAMPAATMPTRSGYAFLGYYDAISAGVQYYTSGGTSVRNWDKASNTTLYAQWSLTAVTCSAGQYLPASSSTCSTCTAGNYCAGGTFSLSASNQGLNACPTNYVNGGTGVAAQAGCKWQTTAGNYIATANATTQTTCTAGNYCQSALVSYGSTSTPTACPTNYVNGGTGLTAQSGCKIQTTAGNYIATANATTATTCIAGSYCPSALVSYGSTGGITACPTNYINGGTGLTAQNQCKFQTSNGNYIATANATTATTCMAGYACPAALIAYGSTGSSTGCAAGYYSQSGWPECDMCETGSFSDDASDSCFSCLNGTTTSGPGATSCDTDCPNNDYFSADSWASSIWNSNNTLTNLCYIESCITGYSGGGLSSCTPNTYTITFDKQSGTGGSTSVIATYDSAMPTATMPTLTNYTFVGYYDAVSAGTMYYNSTGTSARIWDKTADTTLYARWSLSAVTCSAGQYLPANATSCATCTAGNYCVGGTYGLSTSNQGLTTCGSYAAGGTGLTAQNQCKISCSAGTYVATARGNCVTLTTDDKYIGADLVNYDTVSNPNTCDTSNGYHITGKSSASDHDSINDCYQTCSTTSIAPPVGAIKTPLNTIEKYPNFCVYIASCPQNYNPTPGGSQYDDSGYTSDPICAITDYCPNTSEMINGACQSCDRENAVSYKSSGNCEVESCVSGYHPNGQACEENIVECNVSNAEEAYKTWSSSNKSFGTCKIQTCTAGYHISSNTCVPDQQDCALENGTGIKEWDSIKNTWGTCTADSCSPGYTSDYSETNDHTKQCGQCKNKYSILGEQAVSSYIRECDIASCMYQGELYNLENNECVPICDIAGYEDETGTMKWSPSSKKCIRQCKDGYTSWPSYSSGSSYPGGDTSAS